MSSKTITNSELYYDDYEDFDELDSRVNFNKYHNLDCCEWTRGIDNLLLRYQVDREEIYNKLVVSSYEIVSLFLSWDNEATNRTKLYNTQYSSLKACGSSGIDNMRCISGDTFTIKTLIMIMISSIFDKKGIPNYLKFHTSF